MRHRSNQLTKWLRPGVFMIAVLLAFLPANSKTSVNRFNELLIQAAAEAELRNSDALDLFAAKARDDNYGPAIFLRLIDERNMTDAARMFLDALRLGVSNGALLYNEDLYLHWTEAERAEVSQLIDFHFQQLRTRHPFLVELLRQERFPQKNDSSQVYPLKILEAARESGRIGSPVAMGSAAIYKGLPIRERKLFCGKLSIIGVSLDKLQCNGITLPSKGVESKVWLKHVESYEKAIRSGVSSKNWSRYSKYCEFVREDLNRPAVCGDLVALLDLMCTLETTNPETAAVNGLPLCAPEFEGHLVQLANGFYKQVFDTDILNVEDQAK